MITGLGVDIVEIDRMRDALRRRPRLKERIFSAEERAYCDQRSKPEVHYALRFAAKEAVSKAMETGWSGQFRWRDVEVVNEASGAPKVVLHDYVASQLAQCKVHVSLSHTENTVVAFAIIEKQE